MSGNGVVIVAAGRGQRMKTSLPKQFLHIAGKPVLVHSIEKFLSFDPDIEIVLVLNDTDRAEWQKISQEFLSEVQVNIASGGKERYDSVRSGLDAIEKSEIVGVHDAVRPCVDVATIQRSFEAAKDYGSGIPVVALKDSIRKVMGDRSAVVNRGDFRIVQTPQTFDLQKIISAYEMPVSEGVTDDATVFEKAFGSVYLVDGDYRNIKITTSEDLFFAESLLRNPSQK